MSAMLRNRRAQVLRGVLLGLVAALLFVPSVAPAITWTQVASYYDGGTYVVGKFRLASTASGSIKKLLLKLKSDAFPPADTTPCSGDEPVCVSTALFNFNGTYKWVDIVTRPVKKTVWMHLNVYLCYEMPALCAPGVTVVGGFLNFCYAPDNTSLPPPAFLHPMTSSACEGAYERTLLDFTPATPMTPVIVF